MKNSSNKANKIPKAFSLLELSIVVLLGAIMIVGANSAANVSLDVQYKRITQDRLDIIYKALGVYAEAHGGLPCPAMLDVAKSDAAYGTSAIDANELCTATEIPIATGIFYGMVPVKTLGISDDLAQDGYKTKIVYVVNQGLTSTNGISFAASGIILREQKINGTVDITTNASFALISFGKNKSGGYDVNTNIQNSAPTDNNELENNSNNAIFMFSSETSDVFDDIVFFKDRSQFVLDFDLLDKIDCPYSVGSLYGGTDNITWPNAKYKQMAFGLEECPIDRQKGDLYPSRICGAFGQWGSVINNCLE